MATRYKSKTQPVGRSKSPISSRPNSKKKSTKKIASARSIIRDDDETMLSMLSAYTNSITRFEGSPRTKSPGRVEDPGDRMLMLKSQLTEALEENAFIKSRLNAELKERHLMEAKYKELNKKFVESKKALQATGAALLQVHNQTSEMKNKRDEREIQLDEAVSLNRNLNSKIAELESRLEQALMANGNGTTMANLKKLIDDKENLIKAMEDQQVQLQGQMSKVRRDNYKLSEENAELQEALESKNRKIASLAKKVTALEEELEAASELRRQSNSRGRMMSPGGPGSGRTEAKGPELRLHNGEDKRSLEQRMAQLELSLKQSESFMHLIQGNPLDGSPMKPMIPQQPGVAPAVTFSYVGPNGAVGVPMGMAMTVPPMTEKPSAPSPRKSPGGGSRGTIRASAGAQLLAPIPVETVGGDAGIAAGQTLLAAALGANKPVLVPMTSNGMLTDALFSSSSVVEVTKVPNAELDKPSSPPNSDAPTPAVVIAPAPAPAPVPGPPVDASPASSTASARRSTKIKKSSKSSKSKKADKDKDRDSDREKDREGRERSDTAASADVLTPVPVVAAPSVPAAVVPTSAAPTPAPAPALAVVPEATPVPVSAAPAAPVLAAPVPAAAAPVTATAPEPTAAPVEAAASTSTPGERTPVKTGSREQNRNSIRTPITSASGRRPASSKKSGESGAEGSTAPGAVEFPPSALIVAKYTEATVDEMLKQGDTDTDSYKTRLLELRKKVKRDIYAWTKSFVNETQRQPTKQERKDLGGPMFRAYTSSQKILKDLGVDVGTESTKMGRGQSVKFNVEEAPAEA